MLASGSAAAGGMPAARRIVFRTHTATGRPPRTMPRPIAAPIVSIAAARADSPPAIRPATKPGLMSPCRSRAACSRAVRIADLGDPDRTPALMARLVRPMAAIARRIAPDGRWCDPCGLPDPAPPLGPEWCRREDPDPRGVPAPPPTPVVRPEARFDAPVADRPGAPLPAMARRSAPSADRGAACARLVLDAAREADVRDARRLATAPTPAATAPAATAARPAVGATATPAARSAASIPMVAAAGLPGITSPAGGFGLGSRAGFGGAATSIRSDC